MQWGCSLNRIFPTQDVSLSLHPYNINQFTLIFKAVINRMIILFV